VSRQVTGFKAWLLQRASSVYVGFFIVLAVSWWIMNTAVLDYSYWVSLFAQPIINVSVLLFFYAVLSHAWVGMRDIVIDYVSLSFLRFLVLLFIALGLFVMAIWVSLILLSVVHL